MKTPGIGLATIVLLGVSSASAVEMNTCKTASVQEQQIYKASTGTSRQLYGWGGEIDDAAGPNQGWYRIDYNGQENTKRFELKVFIQPKRIVSARLIVGGVPVDASIGLWIAKPETKFNSRSSGLHQEGFRAGATAIVDQTFEVSGETGGSRCAPVVFMATSKKLLAGSNGPVLLEVVVHRSGTQFKFVDGQNPVLP